MKDQTNVFTRLSDNFILLDFLYDRDNRKAGYPSFYQCDNVHIEEGTHLINTMLEPLIKKHGIPSISSGVCVGCNGPHLWRPSVGAAVDAWFMDSPHAPIEIVKDVYVSGIPYERLITYAGSGYVCIATKTTGNARKIYENKLNGKDKPTFVNYMSRAGGVRAILNRRLASHEQWLRDKGSPVYHTMRQLRAEHIRVSRFFSLKDMFRSYVAVTGRYDNVDESLAVDTYHTPQHAHARFFGGVLDQVYLHSGYRPSVIRGLNNRDTNTFTWHDYNKPMKLWFSINKDVDLPGVFGEYGKVTKIKVTNTSAYYELTNTKRIPDIRLNGYVGFHQQPE